MREIRTPAVAKKINDALREIPGTALEEVESHLRGACLKCAVVRAGTKTANVFKRRVEDMEHWADGYVAGTGRECSVVHGSFSVVRTVGATSPVATDKRETRQIVFVVHDAAEFLRELRDLAAVLAVQVS